jgi:small-conductance mechanosensitive channel
MYWIHVHAPFLPHSHARVLTAMSVSLVAYVLIELVAWLVLRWRNPQEAREPRDERERLIDLKALRIAYYAFVVCALAGMFVTLHLAGAGPEAMAMVVFLAFILSQVIKHAARIYYYRRDA